MDLYSLVFNLLLTFYCYIYMLIIEMVIIAMNNHNCD